MDAKYCYLITFLITRCEISVIVVDCFIGLMGACVTHVRAKINDSFHLFCIIVDVLTARLNSNDVFAACVRTILTTSR